MVSNLLVDGNIFSVGKHLPDTENFVPMKIEFSQNYTKLGTLPTKVYTGNSKNEFSKKNLSSENRAKDFLMFTLMPCLLSQVDIWLSV